jgi:small-conductance mechanosensitive channel
MQRIPASTIQQEPLQLATFQEWLLIWLGVVVLWSLLYWRFERATGVETRWQLAHRLAVQYLPPLGVIVLLASLGRQDWVSNWMSDWTLPGTILGAVVLATASAWSIHWLWTHLGLARGGEFSLQAWILIVIPVLAVAVVVAEMPEGTTKGQVITFFGVVVAAVFTLSSTSFASNAIAGVMLRGVRSYKLGDWIEVGDQLGRVTQRGLVHTEIETDNSDLTTIPNLYLVTHPFTVIPGEGTIVSATVSIGYYEPHWRIEPLLKEAGGEVGLEQPFCQIVELGDYSVTYRAAGMLRDVRALLTTRSRLRRQILVALHGAGIEITSPLVVARRPLREGERLVPDHPIPPAGVVEDADLPERVIFERTRAVEQAAEARRHLHKIEAEIEEIRKTSRHASADERQQADVRLATLERRRKVITEGLLAREGEEDGA